MYLIADWQELLGIITIILGPVCAWVSSWILYVFGELVEDIHATRDKEGKANREVEESQDTFKLAEPEENFVPIPSKTVVPNKHNDYFFVLGKWIGVNTNSLKRSDFTPLLLCIGQSMLFFAIVIICIIYQIHSNRISTMGRSYNKVSTKFFVVKLKQLS